MEFPTYFNFKKEFTSYVVIWESNFMITVIKIYWLYILKTRLKILSSIVVTVPIFFCFAPGQSITQITLLEASGGSFSIYYNLASIYVRDKENQPK